MAGSLRAISANRTIKSWPSACGTIWAHLKAQLVADWPPAPTHSRVLTHCPLWHSALWDFCWWKEQSTLFRPLWFWFEFRSRNSWLTACFLLPYVPSAPYFSHFLHADYSPAVSSSSATHCVCVFVEQPWKQLTVNISLGGVRRWKNSSELKIFPY